MPVKRSASGLIFRGLSRRFPGRYEERPCKMSVTEVVFRTDINF